MAKKMIFKTFYDFDNNICESGSPIETTYKYSFDKNGTKQLIKDTTYNRYEEIQEYERDTNIYTILEKYVGGDLSVLDKNKGIYADISKLPKDLSGLNNTINEATTIFNGLPSDFKSLFNNDPNLFIKSIKEKQFDSILNNYNNSIANNSSNSSTSSNTKSTTIKEDTNE